MTTKMNGIYIMAVSVVLALAIGMVRSDNLADVEPVLNARGLFVNRENLEPVSSSLNYNERCYPASGYPVNQPYRRPSNRGSSYGQEQSSKLASLYCNNQYARYYDGLEGVAGIIAPYGVSNLPNVGAPSSYSTADGRVGGVGGYTGGGGYGNTEYGNVAGFGNPGGLRVGDIGENGGPYGDVWSSNPKSYLSAPGQFISHISSAVFPQAINEGHDSAQ